MPHVGESVLTFAATITLHLLRVIVFLTRNRKKPHIRDYIGIFSIYLNHPAFVVFLSQLKVPS